MNGQNNLTGYKVVELSKGKMFSFVRWADAKVRYYKSKWSAPKNDAGPLAVFKTIKAACEFIEHQSTLSPISIGWTAYAVIEVRYTPSEHKSLWYYDYTIGGTLHRNHVPDGTDFAERVKFRKEIYRGCGNDFRDGGSLTQIEWRTK